MPDNVLMHPLTQQALEQAAGSQHHAIALVGPYGAGKGYLAMWLVERLFGRRPRDYEIFQLTKESPINIEEIRALHAFLRLKTTGKEKIRRAVIIENAQSMTVEAQNALLKTLEEPPEDTRIILTVTDINLLKETVRSRLQLIHVQPVTLEAALEYFDHAKYGGDKIKKAYLISAGRIGLCSALLEDGQHDLVDAIAEAKSFLQASVYERLAAVDKLSKDKVKTTLLLFAVKRILSAAAKSGKTDQAIGSMAGRLKTVYETERALNSNPNMKLLLTNLALNL